MKLRRIQVPSNNSFKPKPLRSFLHPCCFSGGFGLIQALGVAACWIKVHVPSPIVWLLQGRFRAGDFRSRKIMFRIYLLPHWRSLRPAPRVVASGKHRNSVQASRSCGKVTSGGALAHSGSQPLTIRSSRNRFVASRLHVGSRAVSA